MDELRVGIVGVGRWGTNYLKTLSPMGGVRVTHACSRNRNELRDIVKQHYPRGRIKIHTSYKMMLREKDIDAIIIATPGSTHYIFTKQALQAGKHVLVEKPLAFRTDDAEELVALAKSKGLTLMVGHLHLFNPAIQTMRDDIGAGILGHLRYIESRGTGDGPIRDDMSALWDFFPHDVSIMMYLFKETPRSVIATGGCFTNKNGKEDVVSMTLGFSGRKCGMAFASYVHPLKQRTVVVVGSENSMVFDDYAERKLLHRCYPNRQPLHQQLMHFLECVHSNTEPITGGQEAIDVVRVLQAAHKSIRSGKREKI